MAHKKGVGSSRNGRDSGPKYLGVKRFAGEFVTAGTIIVRQRGTKFHPGTNVRRASDDSLFTVVDGQVRFEHKNKKRYQVSVYPTAEVMARIDLAARLLAAVWGAALERAGIRWLNPGGPVAFVNTLSLWVSDLLTAAVSWVKNL